MVHTAAVSSTLQINAADILKPHTPEAEGGERRMTDKQIRALMIQAQSKPVVIFCRTEEYADCLRQEIKDGVFKLFPTLLSTYITTGYDIFIKGHEKIPSFLFPRGTSYSGRL